VAARVLFPVPGSPKIRISFGLSGFILPVSYSKIRLLNAFPMQFHGEEGGQQIVIMLKARKKPDFQTFLSRQKCSF
jgi:hypothetical protein